MGICLQLVTSKFWSFLHDSMIAKIPSADVIVSANVHCESWPVTVLVNLVEAVPSSSNSSQLPMNGAASSPMPVLLRIKTRRGEVDGSDSDGKSDSKSEDLRWDKLDMLSFWQHD
jgi:hypothetical protein